jgi:enoyl-CoA hydratase
MEASTCGVRYERTGPIATLTIDRPERRNAMTRPMVEGLLVAISHAREDDDLRVLVLRGVAGAFCSGTDLTAPDEIEPAHEAIWAAMGASDGWWPLVTCPFPVIASIDGPAIGMGAELASHCDVRIASDRAWFQWNFVHRGLVPDTGAGTWLLPRLIGGARALELLLTGRRLEAGEALQIGYVASVVGAPELDAAVHARAMELASASPVSARLTKQLYYDGLRRDPGAHLVDQATALASCVRSGDHAEGVAAFHERREPRFTGR